MGLETIHFVSDFDANPEYVFTLFDIAEGALHVCSGIMHLVNLNLLGHVLLWESHSRKS